jgi:membrane associated rhomboid family serine protease
MDWSLVLASQGIEATILGASEEHGWILVVPDSQYPVALRAIRLYRMENQRSRWQHALPGTGLVHDARALQWCLIWIVFFAMEHTGWPHLHEAGLMDSQAVASGQWWRLFTAVTLHADLAHLMANATIGFLLLGLAMAIYGFGWAFLAAYLAGAGGNVAGWLLSGDIPHRSLGASGMVMGALGLLAVQSIVALRSDPDRKRLVIRGLLGGLLLLVLLGFDPKSDVTAHTGGFFCGILLGWPLRHLPLSLQQEPLPNRLAELAGVGLMILTWWLALIRN